MDPQPRASAIEYIGLTMLVVMLGVGLLAVVAPESILRAVLRSLWSFGGAT